MNPSSYAAIAAASIIAGYWLGAAQSWNQNGDPSRDLLRKPEAGPSERLLTQATSSKESEGDSDTDFEKDGDLSQIKPQTQEDTKLVLVVRNDLGMSIGKIAAQCSHATLACYKTLAVSNPALLRHWERTGQTKVALRCADEEELQVLQAQAQSLNLCARSIQDAGRTQVVAGSRTVLGIGPGPVRLINQITGRLKLL